ncbi:YgeY family selenium metabolism-linked hydrolase [Longimycelium tulufanense]|uniref:YgeY family selenium metabolism-linked hydrolase n=1 Tax=Longimycelium tulufanense TaxID=907463 RepID=UPI001667DED7|nr:YgeY family selenium metabolism-linked hydrolase [Longimycelium tulufanense]
MRDGSECHDVERFLLRLLAAPSLSTQEAAAAEVLRAELVTLGFEVETDELGNVIGVLDLGPGPTILLDSHLDTVGVERPEAWSAAPSGERRGDLIYGRGAVDMKGPLAACVHGVASLGTTHDAGRIVVSGSVAEELVEGAALVPIVQRVAPDYVVICEPTAGALALGQRGRAEVVVEVTGKPCHSAYPAEGVNAAEVMAEIICEVRCLPATQHPVLGDGILVLTDLASSPLPSLSVVPARCTARFDRRTLPGELLSDVLEPIRSVAERVAAQFDASTEVSLGEATYTTYTGCAVRAACFAPAWVTEPGSTVAESALQGFASVGMTLPVSHYSFCTNGSATAGALGVPTIGYGPGAPNLAHQVDEAIALSELREGVRGYAALVRGLTSRA